MSTSGPAGRKPASAPKRMAHLFRFTAGYAAGRARAVAASISERMASRRIPQVMFDKLAVVWLIAETMQAPTVYRSALAGCIRLYPAENSEELHGDVLRVEPHVRRAADAIIDARYKKDESKHTDNYFGVLKELTIVLQSDAEGRTRRLPGVVSDLWKRHRARAPETRVELCERHVSAAVRLLLSTQLNEFVAEQDRLSRSRAAEPPAF